VPDTRVVVCRPGVPEWVRAAGPTASWAGPNGYILFVGTLEPRKNVMGLLDAYERLLGRKPDAPNLVLAGGIPPMAEAALRARLAGPLAARVEVRGYLPPEDRPGVYAGASMLVLPSHMEGFGLPVLEALALGIPVLVSDRGALPEVAGDAGLVSAVGDADGLAAQMARVIDEPGLADTMRIRGFRQAELFNWHEAATAVRERLSATVAERRGGRP